MRALLIVILLLPMLAVAQGKRDPNEIFIVETGDPEMDAAIRRARLSLDEFLKTAAAPPPATSGFKLKVAVRDNRNTEHFWVTPFRVTESGFEGILANEPRLVHTVKHGQTYRFTRADITDWGYEHSGRQIGSFTVCVVLGRVPKEQAEFYRREHGFDCPPA
jgi:uncharacterized protein YegJ (DUF2314 family)